MSTRKLCMIPGPVEFNEEVLAALAAPALSHVSPEFIEKFGTALELLRKVFLAPSGQPFVLAGSGTLTWDITASNLVEPGESVLVINTGIFGDWFGECLEVYGAKVTQLRPAEFGGRPSLQEIEQALVKGGADGKPYKLVTITHVDTSTGVLHDAEAIAKLVHQKSPSTLIALDGVCSVAAEEIRQEEWRIDVVMTGSQKALGVPPGLAVMVVSQRALSTALTRAAGPSSYFCSFAKWLPIMKKYEARQPSYFGTPAVGLVSALEVSLKQILAGGLDKRFELHKAASQKVKSKLQSFGLKLVPVNPECAANSLTAVYFPPNVTGPQFLPKVAAHGVVIAGGLHPNHAAQYFRVGHMNISATENDTRHHLDITLNAIEQALKECGYVAPQQ
ncbi:pyridoxal phosphate-dependent transferase [Cladochytrium replicatum]|nr:pyridoxal phosphate-dependent transferase [Cladochytrium replicatum]